MLIELYLLIVVIAFACLLYGLKYGSLGAGSVLVGEDNKPKYLTKLFLTAMFLLISAILFFILASASYDIEISHCDYIVNATELQPDNITTEYNYVPACNFEQHTDSFTGDMFMVFGWIAIILLVIYAFKEITEMVS